VRHDLAHQRQGVLVVLREVVRHAGDARVYVGAAQLLGGHFFAGGRFDQRRAAQEDGARAAHDDRLVAHGGHVSAAGGAAAHHGGYLRDAGRAHACLVEEDPSEVLAVREDLRLEREEGAAGVHEVDARKTVLLRDLLGAQVLLHRDGVVGAAFDRGVVGDDHHLASGDDADPGDDPGGRHLILVHAAGGERAQLEEGRLGIAEQPDAVSHEKLAALAVPLPGLLGAPQPHALQARVQVRHQSLVGGGVLAELRRVRADL
jgi:hypothetical protein